LMAEAYARKKVLQGIMFDDNGYRTLMLRKHDEVIPCLPETRVVPPPTSLTVYSVLVGA
jgi:hypothetical protein